VKAVLPASGEPVTLEFVADKAGTFGFSCSEYCGSGHSSMRGRLVVAEKPE
jgi:cytochrome c oxidase subunit II